MDCRDCSSELTAYIDGELGVDAAEKMKVHLEKCRPCHDEFLGLRDATAFVETNAPELEPVPEIWNNLRSRIAEMPPPGKASGFFHILTWNGWITVAATVAASAVLAIGLWGYWQHLEAERTLLSYMNDYIEKRAITERFHRLQLTQLRRNGYSFGLLGPGTIENPFSAERPASIENPFRMEER